MMKLDITFCSNKKCKNKKCERNQNNYDFNVIEIGNHPISIADFSTDCKEVDNKRYKNGIEKGNRNIRAKE